MLVQSLSTAIPHFEQMATLLNYSNSLLEDFLANPKSKDSVYCAIHNKVWLSSCNEHLDMHAIHAHRKAHTETPVYTSCSKGTPRRFPIKSGLETNCTRWRRVHGL